MFGFVIDWNKEFDVGKMLVYLYLKIYKKLYYHYVM